MVLSNAMNIEYNKCPSSNFKKIIIELLKNRGTVDNVTDSGSPYWAPQSGLKQIIILRIIWISENRYIFYHISLIFGENHLPFNSYKGSKWITFISMYLVYVAMCTDSASSLLPMRQYIFIIWQSLTPTKYVQTKKPIKVNFFFSSKLEINCFTCNH